MPAIKALAPPINLLYAGKLSLAKGVDWLLRTFFSLQDPRLHLHLVGSVSGEETRQCLQLANKASARVIVHGEINQEQLARLIGICHIFVLPPFFEGLPLVLLEAIACGCRVVTTDLPGCRELLARAGSDLVSFVKLHDLCGIDRPASKDWHALQIRLAAAITDMVDRVCFGKNPSMAEISTITAEFRWQAVFGRILSSYEKAISC